jgi:raffinose/stachyose/melibiose transport system substrate-binding protein
MFANQEVAMIQQGNWKQSVIFETDPDLDIGLLPIFTSDDEEKANRIPVGIPFMFVVNNQSPETEKQAAKDFLTWLVSSDEGKQYLAEEFDVIPALDNIEASPSLGGVSKDIVAFAQDGKTIPWMFSYWPDGAVNEFSDLAQRYVAGLDSFTTYLENLQNSWDRLQK